MRPQVVVSQFLFPEAIQRLRDAGLEVIYREEDHPAPYEELRSLTSEADALICMLTDRVDGDLLSNSTRLSVVANVAVGYDNIDTVAASRAGVVVTNTPGVLSEATADLTFALLLATARRVTEADAFLRAGRYRHWKLEQEQLGLDVHGQTLGLFGLGEIGSAVARRASRGFDMKVVYYTRRRLPRADESRLGARYVPFDRLLRTSDFVSIHVPLTDETRHAIDASALSKMKSSAILLNTARGPVVDESALVDALVQGAIAGAGLDVYEREPTIHPGLLGLTERVVLLPHLGSATVGTRSRMAHMAVTNVIAALKNGHPPNRVDGAGRIPWDGSS